MQIIESLSFLLFIKESCLFFPWETVNFLMDILIFAWFDFKPYSGKSRESLILRLEVFPPNVWLFWCVQLTAPEIQQGHSTLLLYFQIL